MYKISVCISTMTMESFLRLVNKSELLGKPCIMAGSSDKTEFDVLLISYATRSIKDEATNTDFHFHHGVIFLFR
jgi:hypothetical protein